MIEVWHDEVFRIDLRNYLTDTKLAENAVGNVKGPTSQTNQNHSPASHIAQSHGRTVKPRQTPRNHLLSEPGKHPNPTLDILVKLLKIPLNKALCFVNAISRHCFQQISLVTNPSLQERENKSATIESLNPSVEVK